VTVQDELRAAARTTPPDVDEAVRRAVTGAVAAGAADVAVTVHDTPIGSLALAATAPGLVAVSFDDSEALMADMAERISPRVVSSPSRLDTVRRQLDEYFDGSRTAFDLPLDWQLSAGFRRAVLNELVQVGYGETVSYQDLARRAGRPKGSRAVGSAMATNPIPVIVPCHRVLRTGGALGGYAGGLEAKRRLLTLEGVLLT
jgi:methylated-DNA-[protein]-cysteine S-methyltransferase